MSYKLHHEHIMRYSNNSEISITQYFMNYLLCDIIQTLDKRKKFTR